MNYNRFLACVFTVGLSTAYSLSAGETNTVEELRQQLRQARESLERTMLEHRKVIEDISRRLDTLQPQSSLAKTNPPVAPPEAPAAAGETPVPTAGAPSPSWRPSDPIRISSGRAYLDLGLVGTFAAGTSTASDIAGGLQLGGHDPNQRGFTVQGVEASFSGAVDPYLRGNANILFSIDAEGESFLELEEAYMETTSLPGNLQLRGGQFFTEFGRHNPTHPHAWGFVDSPLVLARFLGPDGLRNPGARVSWLVPTPFYSELFLGLQNSHGETAYGFRNGEVMVRDRAGGELPLAFREAENDRGVGNIDDLLITPRYAASFDLTASQTVLAGASAAFGPNSRGGADAGHTDTQIYGADLTWKWKPARQSGGFPFVSVQTEGLLRRYQAGAFDWDLNGNGALNSGEVANAAGLPAALPEEMLADYGFYTQALYGFRPGWVAGLRLDYLTGDRAQYERLGLSLDGRTLGRDPNRAERWRLSPNLTWYPSEFSKIRLQYNYDDREEFGVDHSVWLQFEFSLGAHAAHKF